MTIELDREDDGRWIAEIPELPGVMACGATRRQALQKVNALAMERMAELLANLTPESLHKEVETGPALGRELW